MQVGDKVQLRSRRHTDYDEIELIRIFGNLYIFKTVANPKFEKWWRMIGGDNNKLEFIEPNAIDPPDGPFITLGADDIIEGFKLLKIYILDKTYLLFEKNEQS